MLYCSSFNVWPWVSAKWSCSSPQGSPNWWSHAWCFCDNRCRSSVCSKRRMFPSWGVSSRPVRCSSLGGRVSSWWPWVGLRLLFIPGLCSRIIGSNSPHCSSTSLHSKNSTELCEIVLCLGDIYQLLYYSYLLYLLVQAKEDQPFSPGKFHVLDRCAQIAQF